MKLSFGMIFSIILIIAFLGFAFIAIQKFLGLQGDITQKQFFSNFNQDISKVWNSNSGSLPVEYNLPNGVKQLCFKNDPYENVYFSSDKPNVGEFVEHLNITESFCIDVVSGKVKFLLEKSYGDSSVRVNATK